MKIMQDFSSVHYILNEQKVKDFIHKHFAVVHL